MSAEVTAPSGETIGPNGSVDPNAAQIVEVAGESSDHQPEAKPKEPVNWQARYDRLMARLGPDLPRVLDKYDGRAVATAAETMDRALKHPELGPAIATWITTGKFAAPQSAAAQEPQEDPYEDPSVKALRLELESVKSQLHQNQNTVLQTTYAQASRVLEERNNAFLAKYPEATAEERDVFLQRLQSRLGGMIEANPQSFLKLDEKTHRMVALDVLEEVVPLDSLYERKLQAKKSGLAALSTGGPLRASTNGTEAPAQARGKLSDKQQRDLARQALAAAMSRRGA